MSLAEQSRFGDASEFTSIDQSETDQPQQLCCSGNAMLQFLLVVCCCVISTVLANAVLVCEDHLRVLLCWRVPQTFKGDVS